MLNPHSDRVDYGEQLKAPEGFSLSHALALTYSLDLETLLCLPLALSFDCPPESDQTFDKLALLEAISQLQGKVKVFFQQGCIKLPASFNLLFSLLEPMLVPQVPGNAFSAFHPKLWLLRFEGAGGAVRYRLLVLSRNLTFDRSWDLAVVLDGEPGRQRNDDSAGLLALMAGLAPEAGDFQPALALMGKELPKLTWARPDGFDGLQTLPRRLGERPLALAGEADTVMVMSPFLHPEALGELQRPGAQHWLFSRAEALDRLGPDALAAWECFALDPRLVEGEDELSDARAQDLHAKLFITQHGDLSQWCLGSANATKAALGGKGADGPRNTEFMLGLSSRRAQHSAQRLREQMLGGPQQSGAIFVPHVFNEALSTDAEAEAQLRALEYRLISADWQLHAQLAADGTYHCQLDCDLALPLGGAWQVQVRPLVRGEAQALASSVTWEGLSLIQVSAFVVLRICQAGVPLAERVVKTRLHIEGGDLRAHTITRTLIDSPLKLLAYIRLLLQPSLALGGGSSVPGDGVAGQGADVALERMLGGSLHEALLRCAAREPAKLQRIDAVLERLADSENIIPPALSTLWAQYRHFAGKHGA